MIFGKFGNKDSFFQNMIAMIVDKNLKIQKGMKIQNQDFE